MNLAEWVIGAAAVTTSLVGTATVVTHSAPAAHGPQERQIGRPGDTPPTEAEARRVLAGLVEAADQRNPDVFCALVEPPLLCRMKWDEAGGSNAVPVRTPHLLATVVKEHARVLILCGVDGTLRSYRSEIPVIYFDGQPKASLGPYWHPFTYRGRLPDGPVVVSEAPSPAPLPAICRQ